MARDEPTRLINTVRHWFDQADQVAHYTQAVASGLTRLEEALLESVMPKDGVLDCGCGAGRVAVALAQRGCRVVGVDISRPLLVAARTIARAISPTPAYVQVGAQRLPFASH